LYAELQLPGVVGGNAAYAISRCRHHGSLAGVKSAAGCTGGGVGRDWAWKPRAQRMFLNLPGASLSFCLQDNL